jgi:hypothetical protein
VASTAKSYLLPNDPFWRSVHVHGPFDPAWSASHRRDCHDVFASLLTYLQRVRYPAASRLRPYGLGWLTMTVSPISKDIRSSPTCNGSSNTPPKHGDNERGPNDSPTEEPGKSSDGNTHTALLFAIGRCHNTQSFVRS